VFIVVAALSVSQSFATALTIDLLRCNRAALLLLAASGQLGNP